MASISKCLFSAVICHTETRNHAIFACVVVKSHLLLQNHSLPPGMHF